MGFLGILRRIQALAEWEASAVAIMILQIGSWDGRGIKQIDDGLQMLM